MSTHSLRQYAPEVHPALRSALLLSLPLPEGVPSVDELEAAQTELRQLKQHALERAKKAAGDLKIIESEFKKMREMEKGKARALPATVQKVKRESSHTPSLELDDHGYSPVAPPSSTGAASTSTLPSINISSPLAQNATLEQRKVKKKEKDKKRKRDSDDELEAQRQRKSPHPPSQKEHVYKPSKLNNVTHSKSNTSPDWTLPQTVSLMPQRPVPVPSLPPGPRKSIEVKEDFSKAKAPPNPMPMHNFVTYLEPWLRPIREEDVGWLEYDGDSVGPYIMPELGRHYTEQWEEEDMAMYGQVPALLDFSASRAAAEASNSIASSGPLPKWDISSLTEADLASDKGLGPVTERLVTALLPAADQSAWKGMMEAEEAYESKANASGSGTHGISSKEKVFVSDFEERVKDTARFYGLLDGEPDFSQLIDDPISTALRQCQRQLREVSALNKARRARLVEIARERLAYQEYCDVRDMLDKNISAMYSRLQRKEGPKANKKKKKAEPATTNGVNGSSTPVVPIPLPNPAALGLGPDEENTLVVPDALKQLVETRRNWVSVIGGGFEEQEKQTPGRVRGVPHWQKSVFEGIEEDVRRELGPSVHLSSFSSRTTTNPI